MKTLITVLAVTTAMLATSAVAKTTRTKAHIQPNTSVNHNAVSNNPVTHNSYCRFEHGETDPDPRVRLQVYRDCKSYEDGDTR
jgi:hypothetical protein